MCLQRLLCDRVGFNERSGSLLLSRDCLVARCLGVALLVLGAAGGGYAWGRAEEAARTRDAAGALAAALRDGSASARAWLGLMENNDVQAALRRCEGRTVWTDATGRRACVVPLWLDPPSSVVPATPGPS